MSISFGIPKQYVHGTLIQILKELLLANPILDTKGLIRPKNPIYLLEIQVEPNLGWTKIMIHLRANLTWLDTILDQEFTAHLKSWSTGLV